MNTLREYDRWRPWPSSRRRPAASISSARGAVSSRTESASSPESLIHLTFEAVSCAPALSHGERPENDVVSLAQMQSSGEPTVSADHDGAIRDEVFTLI